MKPKRNYVSIPLGLLLIWSLAMVFCHNKINVVPNSIINYYFNVSIMFEGFIYMLCGIALFYSIVRYSKNPKFIFLLLPVAFYPITKNHIYGGRITIPAAFFISLIIYLFLNRKIIIASLLSLVSVITAISIWPWVQMKFACRPYVWIELLKQIKDHPFVGSGFNHTLYPDNMMWVREINSTTYGWIYRHNDFLSIGAYLGIIASVFIIWFVIENFKRIGISIYLIPFLTIVLTSFFQMTLFLPTMAAICIVIVAICIKETQKGDVA